MRAEGYRISQRKRKRVEEIFGWLKTVGGLRKSRFIGQAKTQMAAFFSGVAYHLLRIAKLTGQATWQARKGRGQGVTIPFAT